MKAGWITAVVAATVMIPGLAACGHGSTSGTSASPSAHPGKASAPSGTLTPPGTKLAVGETATVGWVLNSFSEKAKDGSRLQVTLVSIDKGSIADVNKAFSLSAGEKRDTAYYARFRIKALVDVPSKLVKAQSPTVNIFASPDKGLDPEFIQFGSGVFEACDAKAPPSPFTSGSSYETCLTYLMPEGTALRKLRWTGGTPCDSTPIVWSGS
jgi:hypothetical protein